MKVTLTFDDINKAKIYTHAVDMYCAIHEAREIIRMRLKHEEVSKEEELFLDRLREELSVGGMDTWQ